MPADQLFLTDLSRAGHPGLESVGLWRRPPRGSPHGHDVPRTRTWPRDDEPATGLSDLDLLVLRAVWHEPVPTRTCYVATDRGRGLFRRELTRRIAPERWTDPVRCRLRHNLRLATALGPDLVGDLLRSRLAKLSEHAAHAAWQVDVMGSTGEGPAELLEHSLEQRLLEAEARWLAEVVARWPDEGWPVPLVRAS